MFCWKRYIFLIFIVCFALNFGFMVFSSSFVWAKVVSSYDSAKIIKNGKVILEKNIVAPDAKNNPWPGVMTGQLSKDADKLFYHLWKYRSNTFTIIHGNQSSLAKMIFRLALFNKDIDASMKPDRFARGAQAFHYSIDQVLNWLNDNKFNVASPYDTEERELIDILISKKVISKTNDGFVKGDPNIRHIVGASKGKRRSLALNLNQERWHVYWDEDQEFRAKYIAKWNQLGERKQKEAIKKLKGYNPDNLQQLIEEWAVWKQESLPVK